MDKFAAEKIDPWGEVRSAAERGGLSVVLPSFNLSEVIRGNLLAIADLFSSQGVRVELVPVDDGSSDETWQSLLSLKGAFPSGVSFVPVRLEKNSGKGAALKAGVRASSGEYVMLLDGDLDINPRQTPLFFESMRVNDADIVIGSKRHPKSIVQYPFHRRIFSFIYFSLVRIFIGLPITDTQTGMKLFKRRALVDALDRMLVKTYAFDLELLSIASSRGAKISEAPVEIKFGNKFGALKLETVRTMAKDSLAVFYRLKILKYYNRVEVPPPLDRQVKVSVVIACPGKSAVLDECLAALCKQTWCDF
jgi:glycosyltransferase involved in cell wall biosynthesis